MDLSTRSGPGFFPTTVSEYVSYAMLTLIHCYRPYHILYISWRAVIIEICPLNSLSPCIILNTHDLRMKFLLESTWTSFLDCEPVQQAVEERQPMIPDIEVWVSI